MFVQLKLVTDAVTNGDRQSLVEMLESGEVFHHHDVPLSNLLHIAIGKSYFDIVKVLLKYGAEYIFRLPNHDFLTGYCTSIVKHVFLSEFRTQFTQGSHLLATHSL